MISKEQALEIAKRFLEESGRTYELDGPRSYEECGRLYIYKVKPFREEDCWFFYLQEIPRVHALRSSTILVISKENGKVMYFGSAGDEG
jgi:hypothetical protein